MRSQNEVELAVENITASIASMDELVCPSEQKSAYGHHLPREQAAVEALKWVLEGPEPAAQIMIAIKTTELAQFQLFLAHPENQVVQLVEQRPATNLVESGVPYHTIITLEAAESWHFFHLGGRWEHFEQEGGRNGA